MVWSTTWESSWEFQYSDRFHPSSLFTLVVSAGARKSEARGPGPGPLASLLRAPSDPPRFLEEEDLMDVDGAEAEAEAEAGDGQGIGEGGGDAAEDQWDIDELDASDAEDTEGEGNATKEGGAELSRQRPAESEAPQDHGRSSSGSGVQLVAVCGICKKSSKDGRLPTPWEMLEEEGVRRGIRDRV